MEVLAFAKATTIVPKKTSTMCALCDTIDHCTDVCPIMVRVKETRGQANVVNQFLRSENNPFSNIYNSNWRNHSNFGWQQKGQQNNVTNFSKFSKCPTTTTIIPCTITLSHTTYCTNGTHALSCTADTTSNTIPTSI